MKRTPPGPATGFAALGFATPPRRRDRHGRGLRMPLIPAGLPGHRTRSQLFDDYVLDAVERLELGWSSQMDGAEFAVEEVPPSGPAPWEHGGVPLGRYFPKDSGLPPRITIYRRPIADRSLDDADLALLIRDVLVEQVAHMIGRAPDEIDPDYRER